VPATIVPIVMSPNAVEAPTPCLHMTIKELAVTAVVATVAVPDTNVTDPKLFAPAAVVVPTEVLKILFPAVPNTKFPLEAVIAPNVAVSVVAEVMEPTVVVIFPAEATIFPVVAVIPVPPTSVVVVVREPVINVFPVAFPI